MTALEKIVKLAKQIKKEKPKKFAKWTDYVSYASKQIKIKSVGKTTALKKAVPAKKVKKQTGTTNIARDKMIQAKPVGKRKAGATAKKPFYYEYRANRTDKGVLLGVKVGKIELTEIGSELLNLEFKIKQLQEQKKVAKLIANKKDIAYHIKVLQSQHKALKAYLNTRAKFI